MCIAIPAEVISIDGPMALVDIYGKRFSVSLVMMSEAVRPGDFVALQAQRYAVSRIAPEDAQAARRFFEDIFPELADAADSARVA
jgi:hydrogenase maturation factor